LPHLTAALAVLAVPAPLGCRASGRSNVGPAPARSQAASGNPCGAVSYGIRHNPGDRFDDVARRRIGRIACAVPCEPAPAFAIGGLGRNEHGGYSYIDVDPSFCQFEGMELPIAKCFATCEGHDWLGRTHIELRTGDHTDRAELCRLFERRRGPPSVGSCDCPADEIVWRPSASEAGLTLQYAGTYYLDCGFPEGNYQPRWPPK
jgi:hypothetical protein